MGGGHRRMPSVKLKDYFGVTCLLVHSEENKTLTLACDASPYGVGTVLSHIMDNKSENQLLAPPVH